MLNTNKIYTDYINLINESCPSCNLPFSKQDLLAENVHRTGCQHFYHTACFNSTLGACKEGMDQIRCLACKQITDYSKDAFEWFQTLNAIQDQVQRFISPTKGLKRNIEPSSFSVQKKQKIDPQAVLPTLPTEIIKKIFFSGVSFNNSNDLCYSIIEVLKKRSLSTTWASLFSNEHICQELRQDLAGMELSLDRILNEEQKTPLIMACEVQDNRLIKIFLEVIGNACDLLFCEDEDGYTALHVAAIRSDATAMELILHAAGGEVKKITDKISPEGDVFDLLMDNNPISINLINCLNVLRAFGGYEQAKFVGRLFLEAITKLNWDILEWLCDDYFSIHSDKMHIASLICETTFDEENALNRQGNTNPNLIKKLILHTGERAWETISHQPLRDGKRGLTALHAAVQSGLLSSVEAILDATGPRALELLKIRFDASYIYQTKAKFPNKSILGHTFGAHDLALVLNHHEIANYLSQKILKLSKEQI